MPMWLMSKAKGVEKSLEGWARRLLNLDVTSVQTTSLVSLQRAPFSSSFFSIPNHVSTQTFTPSFYHLLVHPEYIERFEPLRREVEDVAAEQGWTRAGMDEMHKIDSFIREAQRMDRPTRFVSSVAETSGPTSVHIFKRRGHPSRHTLGAPAPFRSYCQRYISERP
jgi:hypothetical protein